MYSYVCVSVITTVLGIMYTLRIYIYIYMYIILSHDLSTQNLAPQSEAAASHLEDRDLGGERYGFCPPR